MNRIISLLLISILSLLQAQSSINIKSGIVNEVTVSDTVTFSQPLLIAFVKSNDKKWFTSFFLREESLFIEEMLYKPYDDKFTIILGQQAIPFGANVSFFDLTRFDPYTYQTGFKHDIYMVGRGVCAYGDVGLLSLEGYYGSHSVWGEGYVSTRASYWGDNYNIGVSVDNQDNKAIDANGFSKYVDYVAEASKDNQWIRTIVKPGLYGVSLLAGYENNEVKSKPLYGVLIPFGEKRPSPQAGNFVSAEFSGKGDVIVKVNCTFGWKLEGFSWKDLGFESKELNNE